MSAAANRDVVERFDALLNSQDLGQLGELCTPGMVNHALAPGRPAGLAGTREFLTSHGRSNWRSDRWRQLVVVAEADYVVQYGAREGHWPGGPFRGVPIPEGDYTRQVAFMYRLQDGRIAERWAVRDDLGMMQQLGAAIPAGEEAGKPDWDEFTARLLDALRRFVAGDAGPYKSLWSHRDDVTIFGGWGAWEQGWAAVGPRMDWAAARYRDGWLDRENLLQAAGQHIAYSVDIERSGGRLDGAAEAREAPLRVTHLFRREDGDWRIAHRHADFLQPRQEAR